MKLWRQTNCKSADVIYLIICTQCGKQYVGETKRVFNERMNSHHSNWTKRRFQRSPDFDSNVFLCCIEHDAQWSGDTRKARESYWVCRLNTYNLVVSTRVTRTKNGLGSECGRLTSRGFSIISEERLGSCENTMKLYTFDGLTQVGYATQRPTVLVAVVCDYLDLVFLHISYLSSSCPPSSYFSVERSFDR